MRDAMTGQDRTTAKSRAREPDSLREKLMLTLIGFMLTGVVGGMLTTWIQQRGWAWQNRVTTIEKDVNNVVATYKTASELLNQRWHAAYRMARALERAEEGAAWKDALGDFQSADRQWALHYANAARDVEFYVDAPFGVDAAADLKAIWSAECDTPAGAALAQARSARAVLELVNHCQQKLKTALEPLVEPAPGATAPEGAARKALIDQSYRRLDQLYRTNDALRCVIFDRAVAIRGALASQSYWSAFFGMEPPVYRIPRPLQECL
jgi:hypothetical protein